MAKSTLINDVIIFSSNDTRRKIMKFIIQERGCRLIDIKVTLNYSMSTVQYHVDMLIRHGFIKVVKGSLNLIYPTKKYSKIKYGEL